MEPFSFANKTSEYDGAQTVNVKSFFPTGSFTWDLNNAQNAEITLTSNLTFLPPIGWKKGKMLVLEVIQGGAGSFTITWPTQFKSVSGLVLVTATGNSNVLVFKCIDNGFVNLIANNPSTRS